MSRYDPYPLFQDIRSAIPTVSTQAAMTVQFETEHHHLEGHIFRDHKLVISFGHVPWQSKPLSPYRRGWGLAPFLRREVSVLAVKPKSGAACLQDDLRDLFQRIAPFLARFGEVMHYGFSSGGFQALALADLNRIRRAVVLAPQVVAGPIPGGPRPRLGDLAASRDGRDSRMGCCQTPEVWVLHDPLERQDAAHARLLTGPAFRHVTTPCTGHGVLPMLDLCGAGEVPAELCLYGDADLPGLYRLLRARRAQRRHRDALHDQARHHPSVHARLARLEAAGRLAPPPHPDAAPDDAEG